MRVDIIDPRTEPVPDGWERLRLSQKLSEAWHPGALGAIAWCSPRTVYLGLVSDGDEPVALFTGDFGGYITRKPQYSTPGKPAAGMYFCRLLAGFNQGFTFADSLEPADRRNACLAFERGLRRRLGLRCFGIVYGNVTEGSVGLVDGWFRLRRPVSPNIVLHNRWQTMDDYFADLPRSRRRTFSRIFDSVGGTDTVEVVSGTDSIDPDQASRLEALTRRKHLGPRDPLFPMPSQYFERLNRQPSVRYFAHRSTSGDLESFDLAFNDGRVLCTTVTGSADSAASKRLHLYHDLYLREIAYLIEHRLHTVEFGKGLFDLKQRFGCVQVPQYAIAAPF